MVWWWIGWAVVLIVAIAALITWNKPLHDWTGWIVLLLALSLGALIWFAVPNYARAAGTGDPCPKQPTPSPHPTRSPGIAPVPLVLEKPEGAVINFLRDRASHSRTLYLQVANKNLTAGQEAFARLKKNTYLTVTQRALDRSELDGTIGPAQYIAVAKVNDWKEVAVTVCVDPARASVGPIDPGTYVGSIKVASREIQPATIPVTVTLQYPGYQWMVPLLAIVTLLAGSFVVWAHETRSKEDDSDVWSIHGLQELPGWIARHYVGEFAGAIAAIAVFTAGYWRDVAWGAKAPEDWLALLGAVFTAFTTALTAAAAIGPRKKQNGAPAQ